MPQCLHFRFHRRLSGRGASEEFSRATRSHQGCTVGFDDAVRFRWAWASIWRILGPLPLIQIPSGASASSSITIPNGFLLIVIQQTPSHFSRAAVRLTSKFLYAFIFTRATEPLQHASTLTLILGIKSDVPIISPVVDWHRTPSAPNGAIFSLHKGYRVRAEKRHWRRKQD